MKKLSLQWRITLMTVLLIGIACVSMELLLCRSGIHYMDSIGESLQDLTPGGETDFFDPETVDQDQDLTIIIYGAQESFCITNWYITAIVIVLSGILAYFVSGHALKPLRSFSAQVEKVQINNLTDMKMNEKLLPEFYRLSHSFNQMLQPSGSLPVMLPMNCVHPLRSCRPSWSCFPQSIPISMRKQQNFSGFWENRRNV